MQQERTAVSPIVLTQSDQFDIDVEPTSEASHPLLEQGKGSLLLKFKEQNSFPF